MQVGDILPGHLFVPFHYGYWDAARTRSQHRAANELTLTAWDPVSKQPYFKYAAVQVRKARGRWRRSAGGWRTRRRRRWTGARKLADKVMSTTHTPAQPRAGRVGLFRAGCAELAAAAAT